MSKRDRVWDAKEVSNAAKGCWDKIFAALAYDKLGPAMDKPGRHVTDPVHGTKDPSGVGDGFRLLNDYREYGGGYSNGSGRIKHGFHMLEWLYGQSFSDALEDVALLLAVPPKWERPDAPKAVPKKPAISAERAEEIRLNAIQAEKEQQRISKEAREKNEQLWDSSEPIGLGMPSPMARYLRSRQIDLRRQVFGDCIRFHPSLPYYGKDGKGNTVILGEFPAMIVKLESHRGMEVLQRCYLTPFGTKPDKSVVPEFRKMMPSPGDLPGDTAIRLGGMPTQGVLGFAEGIENALSAIKIHGFPVWAAYSANMLATRDVPKGVHTVLIYEDKDASRLNEDGVEVGRSGQRHAQMLKQKLEAEGIAVHVLSPQMAIPEGSKGVDWNYVLTKQGRDGFLPQHLLLKLIQSRKTA